MIALMTYGYFEVSSRMDPHMHLISYSPNQGIGFAVNTRVIQASERWMFLDRDLDISTKFKGNIA
jgi:hypothetical protein